MRTVMKEKELQQKSSRQHSVLIAQIKTKLCAVTTETVFHSAFLSSLAETVLTNCCCCFCLIQEYRAVKQKKMAETNEQKMMCIHRRVRAQKSVVNTMAWQKKTSFSPTLETVERKVPIK